MADPVSDLAVCRQRLDVLEQQAKAAEDERWRPARWWNADELRRKRFTNADADFIAAWSPAAVLALVGWIRQTLDGAENVMRRHTKTHCECSSTRYFFDYEPCSDYAAAAASIAGLAAVLAPEQAVKP